MVNLVHLESSDFADAFCFRRRKLMKTSSTALPVNLELCKSYRTTYVIFEGLSLI